MKIEFLDLKAQYKSIRKEINQAINDIINSSEFIMGKAVIELEEKVASYCGVKYGVGLNSGSDALFVALKALNIKKGEEVITTSFTFISTAEVIALLGAKPVFVDIDPKTFNINTSKIEEKITSKTKAIIPVHLYGQPADMDQIMKIAKKHKLYVIEDAAQAIGAKYNGQKVCSFGDIGCLSFFPSKNLGAYGDGGMLVTNNEKIAGYVRMWRVHGAKIKYYHDFIGDSSRLDSIQAAILLVKLKYLDEWSKKRAEKAKIYNQLFKETGIITPYVNPKCTHIYHQYTIRVKEKRDKLVDYLKQKGVPTMIYYPMPLYMQIAFKYLGYKKDDFPESEKASHEVLSLPVYPELNIKNQKLIVQKIKDFFK